MTKIIYNKLIRVPARVSDRLHDLRHLAGDGGRARFRYRADLRRDGGYPGHAGLQRFCGSDVGDQTAGLPPFGIPHVSLADLQAIILWCRAA